MHSLETMRNLNDEAAALEGTGKLPKLEKLSVTILPKEVAVKAAEEIVASEWEHDHQEKVKA